MSSGGIGIAVALWIVSTGTTTAILSSRTGRLPKALSGPSALVCDNARRDAAMAATIVSSPATVIHAAGIADQGKPLVHATRSTFEAITAPKVKAGVR